MDVLPPPGCPDVNVDLTRGKVEILKPVTFEKGKSKLVGNGKHILSQVATTLAIVEKVGAKHGPPLAKFLVEGHTNCTAVEKRGNRFHMSLSSDRANRCLSFLVGEKGC